MSTNITNGPVKFVSVLASLFFALSLPAAADGGGHEEAARLRPAPHRPSDQAADHPERVEGTDAEGTEHVRLSGGYKPKVCLMESWRYALK